MVTGGIVEVQPDIVTILADASEHVDEIDVERASEACRRAEEYLKKAEKHHKIVGFLIGIKTHDEIAKILMLSVNENHRKQGIGFALLINFLQEMLLQNIRLVNLEVRTNNKIANTFYKKHGFDIQEKRDTCTGNHVHQRWTYYRAFSQPEDR